MVFRWINKQPGMQKLWNLCSHYHDICDWITPFYKPSRLIVYSNTAVYGGNEYDGKSNHMCIFTIFSPFKDTDNM